MNLRHPLFVRLLLVALLLGSEGTSVAQSSEHWNTDSHRNVAPAVSSGFTFGTPEIVLRSRADTLDGVHSSRRLPQDTGHIAVGAYALSAAAKYPFTFSLNDLGPVSTEVTLILQHTCLQI